MTDSNIVAGLRTDAALFRKMPPHAKVNMNPEFMREMSQLWIAAADEIERLRAERDEARRRTNSILTEIDCRIEHGAESNGHLEVLRDMFKEDTDE